MVNNPPANAGGRRDVGSIPDWDDPLEWEMATRSSTLTWKIPLTEEPGGRHSPQGHGIRHDWATRHTHIVD